MRGIDVVVVEFLKAHALATLAGCYIFLMVGLVLLWWLLMRQAAAIREGLPQPRVWKPDVNLTCKNVTSLAAPLSDQEHLALVDECLRAGLPMREAVAGAKEAARLMAHGHQRHLAVERAVAEHRSSGRQ